MAITIDPTVPQGSEAESLGASRIRNVSTALQQMFGAPGTSALTYALAPFATTDQTTGLLTVQGNPTVPLGVATKQYVDASASGQPIILTGSGTFTTVAAVALYRIIMIGGGGGGGGGAVTTGGGGGGAGAIAILLVVGDGAAYTYSVGTGGAGGTSGSNGSGGATTIWTGFNSAQALGGAGGGGSGALGAGGSGGAASSIGVLDGGTLVIQTFAGNAGIGQSGGLGGAGALSWNEGAGGAGGNASGTHPGVTGSNGTIIVIPGG